MLFLLQTSVLRATSKTPRLLFLLKERKKEKIPLTKIRSLKQPSVGYKAETSVKFHNSGRHFALELLPSGSFSPPPQASIPDLPSPSEDFVEGSRLADEEFSILFPVTRVILFVLSRGFNLSETI